jgi:hypothetical protein
MGLFDSFSKFLDSRSGDFVKLDTTADAFGPGPLLVLYNVPDGVTDDEIQDMLADGAPQAFAQTCTLVRIQGDTHPLLDVSMEVGLHSMVSKSKTKTASTPMSTLAATASRHAVLLFSGFRNDEMMQVYNILGLEIYQETGGASMPACAKAVPNAMHKPLRQVLDEIAGDHDSALQLDRTNPEQ